MINTTAEEIQVDIEDAKAAIAMADALERLHNNPDFKKVVLEGYFKENAVRLVNLKAHPAMQNDKAQEGVIRGIDSIGELRQYFSSVFQAGNTAHEAIRSADAELAEMADEGEI